MERKSQPLVVSLGRFATLLVVGSLGATLFLFFALSRLQEPWELTLEPSDPSVPAVTVRGLNLVLGSIGEGVPPLDSLVGRTVLRVPPARWKRGRYYFKVLGAQSGWLTVGGQTFAFEDSIVSLPLDTGKCHPIEVRLRGLQSKVRLVYKKYHFSDFEPVRWPFATASCEPKGFFLSDSGRLGFEWPI